MSRQNNTVYVSPKVKTVEFGTRSIICTSFGTESYTVSSSSYDDNDFE